MSTDIVATSQNIENIRKMLNLLQGVKEDSGKLREISLDDTGWEGMDATAFNSSLNNFTQKLDKTSTDIEEALFAYKSKQEEQLESLISAEAKARALIEFKQSLHENKVNEAKNKLKEAEENVRKDYASPISIRDYNKAKEEYNRLSMPSNATRKSDS